MAPDADPALGKPWWKGARGEWLVAIQVGLIVLVFFGPRTAAGLPSWPLPFPAACRFLGGLLMAGGIALLAAGLASLGRGLTPLPYPKKGAGLIQRGPYALVRHPMYSGGILMALGWAIFVQGWLTLGYAALLFVFLDLKSRLEERWLAERFPAYGAYRKRVRKLIPFLY